MNVFKKPYWIYIAITAPQLLLIMLYLGAYNIISPLLKPENITAWIKAGSLISVPLLGFTLLAAYMQFLKRDLTAKTGVLIITVYCAVIITFISYSSNILPFNIPAWMFSRDDLIIAPIACGMPAVIYGMLLVVAKFMPRKNNKRDLALDIGVTVGIPLLWYILFNVIGPLLRSMSMDHYILTHITLIAAITSSLALLFVIIRLSVRVALREVKHSWLLRLPFALLLPLTCFIVHNASYGFLGDLDHPIYYIITLVCGVVVTIPPVSNSTLRFTLLIIKAACWPFVFYFFIALLPFMPIAVFAIIFFGIGFLLLGPTILLVLLTKSMHDDIDALKGVFPLKLTATAILCAILLLPVAMTSTFIADRAELQKALIYTYEPDYLSDTGDDINLGSIKRVIDNVRAAKSPERGMTPRDNKPYITSYYNWLVLDNLTLSNKRLRNLEALFTGYALKRGSSRIMPLNDGTEISGLRVNTTASKEGSYDISTVDLEITNKKLGSAEYVTSFELPIGAWISRYYLDVYGERVEGMLTDKRAATWVYRNIVSNRRDPGIMYYTQNNRVVLRVFPFAEGEVRTTGFEIIHREAMNIQIDERTVRLGSTRKTEPHGAGNAVLISPSTKASLPKITRLPYYHFIIDMSEATANKTENFIRRVNAFIDNDTLGLGHPSRPRMTLVGYRVSESALSDGWDQRIRAYGNEGGFNLEHALKKALLNNYQSLDVGQPVFVVITDDLNKAVFATGMDGFEITYPEDGLMFVAGNEGKPNAYQFMDDFPVKVEYDKYHAPSVLRWPDENVLIAYLADNDSSSVVISSHSNADEVPDKWEKGLSLYGKWIDSKLRPKGLGQKRLDIIKGSLKSKIMTKYTSYISLENEAQRRALLKKQKELLSTDKIRDLGEEQEMSEPPLWLLIALLTLGLAVYMRKYGGQIREGSRESKY